MRTQTIIERMEHRILPTEFIDDSLESYLGRHARNRHRIYLVTVSCVLAGVAALPAVHVDVSTQAPGIVRPVIDTHEISSPTSAPVSRVLVSENQVVREGDALIELRTDRIEAQLLPIETRIRDLRLLGGDLDVVLRRGSPASFPVTELATSEVSQAYVQYLRETDEVGVALARAESGLSRLEQLHATGSGTQAAVEDAAFTVAELRARDASIRETFFGRWESTRTSYRNELRDLIARREQLTDELELYAIRAPVTGTTAQVVSLSAGSFVTAGQRLMVISPLRDMVAEVYVESRDIAYVRPDMNVQIQVDAFNYRNWGLIEGRVLDVADDVAMLDNVPIYRVRCDVGDGRLHLNDGRIGLLQKGMTLRARFSLGRRSLFQLLRDDVGRWLDPLESDPSRGETRA